MLNSRHDIPHPYPKPLPMWMFPNLVGIVRLLNIICTPSITSCLMLRSFIFWNNSSWFTMSYAFAKSRKSIHNFSSCSLSSLSSYTLHSSLYIFNSVPCPSIKPVYWWCSFHYPSLFQSYFFSSWFKQKSYIFHMKDIIDIGLVFKNALGWFVSFTM